MSETTRPHLIKQKQYRTLGFLCLVTAIGMVGLYSMLAKPSVAKKPKEKLETMQLATPLTQVDAQSIWIERAQHQLAQEVKKSDGLRQQLDLLQQAKESQDKTVEQQGQTLQVLQQQVANLQKEWTEQTSGMDNPPNSKVIRDVALPLTQVKSDSQAIPAKNPNTFVPAGTFVRAIALGGADISAGVTSQGNPTPMLFRLLEEGTLPNARKSHLKGCLATAAAIGDISAERGAIRLERLSCTKPNGEVIERVVEATVFGPDGKEGVRGTPLWREGALLQRAFAAGTLSSLSKGLGQSYTTSSLAAQGGTLETIAHDKLLPYSVATGMGNAADTLADYHIKRAEQYHPVIQLSAGTVVDIVFLKGFHLENPKEDAPDYLAPSSPNAENNAPEPLLTEDSMPSDKVNTPSPLPLTPQQIQALKAKNAKQGYF